MRFCIILLFSALLGQGLVFSAEKQTKSSEALNDSSKLLPKSSYINFQKAFAVYYADFDFLKTPIENGMEFPSVKYKNVGRSEMIFSALISIEKKISFFELINKFSQGKTLSKMAEENSFDLKGHWPEIKKIKTAIETLSQDDIAFFREIFFSSGTIKSYEN